ncbi:MAG TPA: MotA/TolQ/ExbB proton channel family protein [Thermodesulfovibrionales bacterium]|nr:MotA/TolQ/ExbB proton channel family protein [Thermodesulfovibrionales bacterium]
MSWPGTLRSSWKRIVVGFIATVVLVPLAAPTAHAWWDGKWKQRMKIQFDTSSKAADIKESLVDVPVLIRLHTGNFTFSNANADGSDIRFVSSDDKTPLKYHIEKFDPREEIALFWVRVPRLSGGSNQDSIWMYYGNASAPDGQSAGGTYDTNQLAVYHLAEKDGNPRDSTAYNNHAVSFTGKLGLPSVVGNGAQLSGATEGQMTITGSPSLTFTKGFTFSAWVRLLQSSGKSSLFLWDDGKQSIVVGLNDGKAYGSASSSKRKAATTGGTAPLSAGRWHHLALTMEPDKQITLYIDGSEAGSSRLEGAVPAPSSPMIIGAAFRGDLDEVQLSNVVRSAGWIRAAFESQKPESVLTSYMEGESGGSSESLTIHLLKVIIRVNTLDGWVIIGTIVSIGIASLFVYRQKIWMFREIKKGNASFYQAFRSMKHPLEMVGEKQRFHGSFYRVYQAGCEELATLLKEQGDTRKLSDIVMTGVRAAVVNEAMRESRRLASGTLLLNIAVTGSPFLGLLGTVWGVMNTFASLAESSEANLAAIAPGVASALACTLAGLMVAIPALYAYSYLTGRMRDLNADVKMFIDAFIFMLEKRKSDAL